MPPPTQVAARAGWGPGLHRLLAGDEEGGWCGAGETAPAVSASASGTLTGHPAATLSVAEAGVDEVLATVVPHLDELDGIRFPAEIRSLLVAVLAPDRPAAPWLALGPPQAAILIRCWPGVSQGPEAGGDPAEPAPLAVAAEAVAAALAGGRVTREELDAALAPARREAISEGRLTERQAGLMEAGGDLAGAGVRRAMGQVHAVHVAVEALRRVAEEIGA